MNNTSFINYLMKLLNVNTVYMWGTYMNEVTQSKINSKAKQYPTQYISQKVKYLNKLIGKNYYGCDCCGLIKAYFMSNGGTTAIKYNSKYDKSAKGITINNASEKGKIATMPEIKGLLLYMDGHCGVYIGNGEVLECTASKKLSKKKYGGVCKTKLTDRKWEYWCKSKWLEYGETPIIVQKTYKQVTPLVGVWARKNLNGTKLSKCPKYKVLSYKTKVEIIKENTYNKFGYTWDLVLYKGTQIYVPNKYLKTI